MQKKIIDFILWEEGFYPFSMKFDLKKSISKFDSDLKGRELDITSKSIFKYSNYFNSYFIEICDALKDALSNSSLNKSLFIELLIADLNRTELLITEDTKQAQLLGSTIDSNSFSNTYIKKPEFQNASESSWGLIDSAIDTTTLNLNYLNYVNFSEQKEIEKEIDQVDVIKHLTIIGSSYNAIKQSYDRIIWRGYKIEDENQIVKLRSDPYHLMLENAALTRLTTNTRATYYELIYSSDKYKDIFKSYHQTRKLQEIKSIEKQNEEFTIKYQAKKKKLSSSFISFSSSMLTYYPFYRSQKIAKFENLTIFDLVNLFSILHDMVKLLPIPDYNDTEIIDLAKFKKFNPKIKKENVLGYLQTTTKYSKNQIEIFLNLLIQKGDKHYLYRYPVYEDDENLFFSHSTIKRANMLYLIDKWLEEGGCDLSERGFQFEDYIRDFLKTKTLNPFAKFEIIEQSMFSFIDDEKNRLEEEIDLVLKTETTIIIAEIKCITYPLEPKEFYSSYGTIKKAKKQIVRKAQFLENNWIRFENILGKKGERKIEKLIVVNFPHFAGRNIEGIAIADFYLFLSYFQSGNFNSVKFEIGKKPILTSIPYYDSIRTFESNFEAFFRNPVPIIDLISRQEIEEYEVTLKGVTPKATTQRVIYNPRTN